ncbi:MAG: GNAT family N-acetyltransferase [Defluviitaleaceae bacterium]|nr:GNAT family N-acetyltransferase [Defluviitaleaceae bacterium]
MVNTERLFLRNFSNSDAGDMLKNWISDEDVQSSYGEPVYTNTQSVLVLLEKWLSEYRFAIILKETNENIGHVSFCRYYEKENTAEIEYCIGKSFWNKGFATEAIKAFIKYTFENTSITKLEAFHRIENPASGRVLQKAGMKPVANVLRFSELEKAPDGDICYAIMK